ncbi:MAG: DUF302 domain-containing protein [Acidithiobacillus ferriphilus]|nr:DUF302 domain-containing protein [Acidithiobacillus ferriphilus]MBU2786355.1 DUF302 domain-containing protein [Acidithiobacillus ferriphilus]MBU2826546.1 DUF302 domain-containing protein [Acidithiobacillus ferriphilus]MBU2845350.1 DUF302 domain-containing protein [Acidithiobacillus ferriphilus]MBU2849024.1 DUF302 domain-containing protein [Acidithiobacillus ferriphilus]MEB8475283.1 DUF302 domain-containing protein [Acidithiobacillus ferriphilus]
MSQFVFSVPAKGDFDTIVAQVTEALKVEGFGVLTTIDVAATLKAKLGIEGRPYVILGACNPRYAHQALEAEPDIGALLPCNVVLRTEADGSVSVVFMDPAAVLGMVDKPQITALGIEVRDKLQHVADAVRA